MCSSTASGLINSNGLKINWHDNNGKQIRNSKENNINTVLIRDNPVTKVSIIKFSNLKNNNTGLLTCVASVGLKIDTLEFKLEPNFVSFKAVQYLVDEIRVNLKTINLTLTCPSKIYNPNYIEWLYNSQVLVDSNEITTFKDKLMFKNLNSDFNGYFSCRHYYLNKGEHEQIEHIWPFRVLGNTKQVFAKIQVFKKLENNTELPNKVNILVT